MPRPGSQWGFGVAAVESGLFGLLGREWVEMEIHPPD